MKIDYSKYLKDWNSTREKLWDNITEILQPFREDKEIKELSNYFFSSSRKKDFLNYTDDDYINSVGFLLFAAHITGEKSDDWNEVFFENYHRLTVVFGGMNYDFFEPFLILGYNSMRGGDLNTSKYVERLIRDRRKIMGKFDGYDIPRELFEMVDKINTGKLGNVPPSILEIFKQALQIAQKFNHIYKQICDFEDLSKNNNVD